MKLDDRVNMPESVFIDLNDLLCFLEDEADNMHNFDSLTGRSIKYLIGLVRE